MYLLPSKVMQAPKIVGHVGVSGPYCYWGSDDIQNQLLLTIMSRSMVLIWLGSVLKPRSCIATRVGATI